MVQLAFLSILPSLILAISPWNSQTSAKVIKIIEGSTYSFYCPFGLETVAFDHYPKLHQTLGKIDNGQLRIENVTHHHNGVYTCRDSSGNQKEMMERLEVVPDPGRYTIRLKTPKLTLNGDFLLECDLEFSDGDRTFAYFLVDGYERLATKFSRIGRNKYRFSYKRPDAQVQHRDDGREVQCVARNRYGDPCCERSRKDWIVVEIPYNTRKTVMELNKDLLATYLSIIAFVISFVALILIIIIVILVTMKKAEKREKAIYRDEEDNHKLLEIKESKTSESSNDEQVTRQ